MDQKAYFASQYTKTTRVVCPDTGLWASLQTIWGCPLLTSSAHASSPKRLFIRCAVRDQPKHLPERSKKDLALGVFGGGWCAEQLAAAPHHLCSRLSFGRFCMPLLHATSAHQRARLEQIILGCSSTTCSQPHLITAVTFFTQHI